MRFPNAFKAVKKLFIAEILSIAVALVGLTSAVLLAIPNTGLTGAGLALGSAVAMIVVFVLQLVAMIQGGKDADGFRTALWVTLIAIAVSITSAVLQSIEATKGLTILISVMSAFVSVAGVLVIYIVLQTIAGLADSLKDHELADKGNRLATYIVLLFAVSILLGLVPSFFYKAQLPDFVNVLFTIFGIVAAVIELLIYINVLIFLRRAIRTLKK